MGKLSSPEILIIGAGLAGLNCARQLAAAGRDFLLLEKSDEVGGRVRTDRHEGFLLDRGFQVLLSAYPEARRVFSDRELDFQSFYPGSLIFYHQKLHRVADPYRCFMDAVESLLNPIGTPIDKLKVRSMRSAALEGRLKDLWVRDETTAQNYLERRGFSSSMINRFFKPFLGGIFLENELQTSSRQLEFVFRMFALGDTVVPRLGMGQLTKSLADGLPNESLRLNTEVKSVSSGCVELVDGTCFHPKNIVIATDGPTCAKWMGEEWDPGSRAARCFYFAADAAPIEEPILALNGAGQGPVNHCCVMSEVSPDYAPSDKSLISINVVDAAWRNVSDSELEKNIRCQMAEWFGEQEIRGWELLRTYNIPHAQPKRPGLNVADFKENPAPVEPGIYVCGDHVGGVSINGALKSGRLIGRKIIEE
jgi:protoporphyrinogen oxidase